MHVDDRLHRLAIGKFDVVKEATAQEGVGQFLLVIAGDDDDRALDCADGFPRFVNMEFHAIEFLQQIVGEFDVGLVDLVDQQHRRLGARERLPQFAATDVIGDVVDALVAQLPVAQARHRVIFVQALLRLGGGLDVPLDQFGIKRLGDFISEHGLAGAGLALDQQGAAQRNGGVDRDFQVIGGDIALRTVEALHRLHPVSFEYRVRR
ncbi:hypothetical protein D9M73_98610 [compost metagenome]